jgi:cell division ATPase FtsA
MGRRRRDGNQSSQNNNSLQYSVGNEEYVYPVPDSNKTMTNVTKDLSDAHKNILKEEILQEITEKFMEKILDMVNQNVQEALKKFQDTKNKKH